MQVTCQSLEEFFECLKDIKNNTAETLFGNCIRFSVIRSEVNEVKTLVSIQIACVVQTETSEYLLQFGGSCGAEYADGDESAGSEVVNTIKEQLAEFGWKILPGIIGE